MLLQLMTFPTKVVFLNEAFTCKCSSSNNYKILIFFLRFQLCAGGSTIELIRNLKKQGSLLTEVQIIYIIHNTLQVCHYPQYFPFYSYCTFSSV